MNTPAYFQVNCLASHQGLVHGEDAEVLVRIDIQLSPDLARVARMRETRTRTGLLLDVSDSMTNIVAGSYRATGRTGRNADGQFVHYVDGGTSKLDALIAAGRRVVGLAKTGDSVTVLHFSNAVSAAVTCDGGDLAGLVAAVERASALEHRGTNMKAGLEALLTAMGPDDGRPRSALLFTDGMPDEETGPRALADRFAEAGVSLSVLGFGDDLRLSYVEELAARGRGRVYSTRDPAALDFELGRAFEVTQQIAVTNLRAHLRFGPCVTPLDLHRAHPQSQILRRFTPDVREAVVPLGNLGSEKWHTLFARFQVRGDRLASIGQVQRLLELSVTADVPSEKRTGERVLGAVNVPVVDRAAPRNHAEVDDAFRMVQARELSARFETHCRAAEYPMARDLAVQLRRIYQSVASPEAHAADRNLGEILARLDREGHLSLAELNRMLNDEAISRTASGVRRPLPSQTVGAAPPDTSARPPDASVTRRAQHGRTR
jgi:hypothetical protein